MADMEFAFVFTGDASDLKAAGADAKAAVSSVSDEAARSATDINAHAAALEKEASAARKAAGANTENATATRRAREEAAKAAGAVPSASMPAAVASVKFAPQTKAEVAALGTSADVAHTKLQRLIEAATGLHAGPANGNSHAWAGALAAEGLALDNLRAKYNPLFAVIQQYKAVQTEIRTAHAMGALSTDEMTAAMQRQRQAALSSIDAIKGRNQAITRSGSMGAQNFAATNAMFQLQDIGVTAAMGMNPGMIALQQGSQLAGNFAGMGIKQVGSTMISAFTQLLSPVALATVTVTGLTAAAIQYFTTSTEQAKTLDEALADHEQYLKRLSDGYKDLAASAKGYGSESLTMLLALGRNDLRSLSAVNRNESKSFFDEVGTIRHSKNWGGGDLAVDAEFAPAAAALKTLREQAKAGKPDFDAFFVSLDKIAKTNPKFEEQADKLAKLVLQYRSANEALREQERLLRQVQARQRGDVIGSQGEQDRLDYLDNQRLSLDRMRDEGAARRSSQLARSPAEKAAAARQTAALDRSGSADEYNLRVELAGTEALTQAEKELSEAKRDRARSLQETVEKQQLELSLIGKTVSEQTALRMEYEQTSALRADAAKNGVAVDQQELAMIRQKAQAYGVLQEQLAAINILRDQQNNLQALSVEIALVGQSETVRRRTLALLEAEQTIRQQGITADSAAADAIRRNASAVADQTAEVERLRDAWGEVQSSAESAIDGAVAKLIDGDFSGALESIKDELVGGITQLAITNPLKNGLLGTNYGTASDLGGISGIVGRLFGGAADPSSIVSSAMQSVGSMAVNAGTVMINGGLTGGLSSLLGGAAANDNVSIGQFASAIKSIESGGNYSALGPVTASGDRAYGAYQVMGANIPSWTKSALGYSLTPEQFLKNSGAQDSVFSKIFGGYASKYGASGAAQAWFGGPGSVGRGGAATDMLGTSGNAYVAKFNSALEKMAGTSDAASSSLGNLGTGFDKFGNALSNMGSGGAGAGGGLAGWLGSMFSPSAASLNKAIGFTGANTTLGSFIRNGFSVGGYTGAGGVYEPRGIVHAGEVVFSQADVARHGGVANVESIRTGRRLGGYASGGPVGVMALPAAAVAPAANSNGSNTSVVVNNYSGQPVQTEEKRDQHGGRQMTMTIGRQVAASMQQRGNEARRTMQSEYGIKPTGKRR